jgi:hypothetical protein
VLLGRGPRERGNEEDERDEEQRQAVRPAGYFPSSAPENAQRKPKQAFSVLRTGAKLARWKLEVAGDARDLWVSFPRQG